MKKFSNRLRKLSLAGVFAILSFAGYSQNHVTMSMQNCSQPTPNTMQFDLYVVNDGTTSLKFNGAQYGINFDSVAVANGGHITASVVNNSWDIIVSGGSSASFSFPETGPPDHVKIIQSGCVNCSGSAPSMPAGVPLRFGTFILTNTQPWTANSQPNFTLQSSAAAGKTICATVVYSGANTNSTTLSTTGTNRDVSVNCNITLGCVLTSFTCPADINVSADPDSCSKSGVVLGTPTVVDNCPGYIVTNDHPSSTYPVGVTIVTWMVTDPSGNTATCTQTVTVTDDQLPTISCVSNPQNRNTDAGVCSYTAQGTEFDPTAFDDNCTGATIGYVLTGATTGSGTSLAGVVFNDGTTTVTWTVADASGNTAVCGFDVIVTDTENPTISCVSNPQNRNTDAGVCTYTASGTEFDPTAFGDNCAGAAISYALSGATTGSGTSLAGVVFNDGTTTVTWTVTDASGNTAACGFDVIVTDTENPTITCPSDVTVSPDPDQCYASGVVLGSPAANDNCPGVTVSNDAPSTFPVGTTVVTWTATDASGNTATCTQNVTVTQCSSVLTLKFFIEGYYTGSGTMTPVLLNQGVGSSTTEVDTVTIELHNATSPYAMAESFTGVLQTDGTITCSYPGSVLGNSYYIVIRHRSAIQTWSAAPVTFGNSTNYDFSTAASQAYSSNMTDTYSEGIWSLYTGDMNQDENMDLLDFPFLESDVNNGLFGYYATDLNGDGNVDLLDFPTMEANINNGIYSIHP